MDVLSDRLEHQQLCNLQTLTVQSSRSQHGQTLNLKSHIGAGRKNTPGCGVDPVKISVVTSLTINLRIALRQRTRR